MTDENNPKVKGDCLIHTHSVPADELSRHRRARSYGHTKRDITSYVESVKKEVLKNETAKCNLGAATTCIICADANEWILWTAKVRLSSASCRQLSNWLHRAAACSQPACFISPDQPSGRA
ncbi:hypothetical protein KRR23_14875 [Pseudomonas sp. CVAP|uniref:hypothetical protein n=1 Tax=Pseudomonas sp. CVAP\|nr:hypothetical protein [Pseudomonas sp. CVAP\